MLILAGLLAWLGFGAWAGLAPFRVIPSASEPITHPTARPAQDPADGPVDLAAFPLLSDIVNPDDGDDARELPAVSHSPIPCVALAPSVADARPADPASLSFHPTVIVATHRFRC
jgi:hypothetical protein